ncbi:odorant-binding protein-like [Bos indicus]|uniref:Odorant-binding protein-like n=1 Tax=Bos indicus TaxID=9915 RepID=A0ABM4S084_BOSIN
MPVVEGALTATTSISSTAWDGDWRIHYAASSNTEKTSETGPLNVYLHNIQFNEEGDSVVFHHFLKADGVCIESSFTGRKIGDNVYTLDSKYECFTDAGANRIHFILVSDDGLIISIENVDEAGNRTRHIGLVGKEAEADDHDLERFKEEVRKLGIPEENIVDFTKVDDCQTQ